MDSDRWRRVYALFASALERGPEERAALLATEEDADLRQEVTSLLASHEAQGPLDRMEMAIDSLRLTALAALSESQAGSGSSRERGPSLEPGQRLGRHEIRARLGAGGMGEVYRAFDTRLRREVAVKILGGRLRHRPEALQRFEREARAVSALSHPNIITLHDIGEEQSSPYIVMELVEGQSLRQMISGPMALEPLLHLAVQIAEGLAAAHEREIVHGDLKPENILVSRQGIAKIVDFGLAQFRLADAASGDEEPEAGTRRALLGTPGYLSPELVEGRTVDDRSDQFSLGAILYEMATGAPAFAATSTVESLARTLHAEPRWLAESRPDLPDAFVRAVSRCLRKDPGQRYPLTRALLEELRAARRDPVHQPKPGAPSRPVRLPAQRTRLIGRQRELEDIRRLITDAEVRLLTLTGAGGTGKTRLALKAAETLAPRFTGGVYFAPLAPLTDSALVATAIAQAVRQAGATDRPTLDGTIAELRDAGAATLLVLDNFEQVIEAAPVVSELLAACPDLTIVVTSRELLRLYGERGFPVSPLELPDPVRLPPPEVLAECPAVALFVERAQAANPTFSLNAGNAAAVAELCAGLDGLPLALELAAAQSRVLAPEAMLSRLDHRLGLLTGGARDLPGRQQTLRRTLDWSHQLLDETEQALFRRLAVLAGPFTLEAAQAVADPYATLGLPLEQGVGALVNKSLLQSREALPGEPRFLMLETLREYAREKLLQSGEEERTREAHAAYFLVLAEEAAVALAGGESPGWLRRLDAEHDDLRAALDWLSRHGRAEWGLRLGVALFHFWERREHLSEGRRRLTALLEREGTHAFPALRAKALNSAGVLAFDQGDPEAGVALGSQSLRIYRELGDRWGAVVVLVALGNQYLGRGDYAQARSLLEESLQLWDQLGDRAGHARSLSNLALVASRQGRRPEARALYQRAALTFAELGDPLSHAWALNHEADVAREQGQLDAAQSLCQEALFAFRDHQDGWGMASSLADLGTIARQRGDLATARGLYGEALAAFVKLDHRRGIARLLDSLACLALDQGQGDRVFQLAAAAAALRERIGVPASADVELEQGLARLRAHLGPDGARQAWTRGAALSLEEAVRLATG